MIRPVTPDWPFFRDRNQTTNNVQKEVFMNKVSHYIYFFFFGLITAILIFAGIMFLILSVESILNLLWSLICFVIAYFIKPKTMSKRKFKQPRMREQVVEQTIAELLGNLITGFFRLIFRVFD